MSRFKIYHSTIIFPCKRVYIAHEQFESPLPKNDMCQKWELVILEKTKIYNDDDNNDDKHRTNFDLSLKTSIVYKQAI